MGTKLSVSGGGKPFDGTDYIYVYGDKDPIGNGQELQDALYQAGIDKVATGRKQTVVVGPGTYSPGDIGNYFQYDGIATTIKSLTGARDVKMEHSGPTRMLSFDSNSSGNVELTSDINSQLYNAQLEIVNLYGNSALLNNQRCKSDYVDLEDGSLIVFNESYGNSSSSSGQRFVKVTNTGFTIGSNINVTYNNFNLDGYWILKNPSAGLSEIYAVGYWNGVNNRILFKINPVTLDIDPSFSVVIVAGGVQDMTFVDNSDLVFVGGFNTVNSFPAVNIAKVDASGILNTSTFNTGAGFNSAVYTVAYVPSNNQIYVGGNHNTYQGNSSKFFTIINNANGNFVPSGGYPNNPVYELKYFPGDSVIYAFGVFNNWGGNSTPGRNVSLQLDGNVNSVLFNDFVSNFSQTSVSATIDDGQKYLRFVILNSNASFLNGTPVSYGNIIELDTNSPVFVQYSPLIFASSYSGGSIPFYTVYARHDTGTGTVSFTGYGNIYYRNFKLLENTATGSDWTNHPDPDLIGLYVNGALVMNGMLNISRYAISNCYMESLFDNASYNNIAQPPQLRIELDNCYIGITVCPSDFTLRNNSRINGMYISSAMKAGSLMAFGMLLLENSVINGAYNSKGMFVQAVQATNSGIYNSFNDGYRNVSYPNSDILYINSVRASNTTISGSFNNSKPPEFFMYNCRIDSSFKFESLSSNVDQFVVMQTYMPIRGEVFDCYGYSSLYYDFSWARNFDTTNMNFSEINITFKNCSFVGGNCIAFVNYPANYIRNTSVIDCHVTNPGNSYSYAFYFGIMHDYNATQWQLGSGDFGNIIFENCTATNVTNAFVIELLVKTFISQLYIRNIIMNNCVHNSFVSYYDFQVSKSMTVSIDSGLGYNTDTFILDRGRITNCSIDAGVVTDSFFTNYYNITNMMIIDYLFKNCHVNNRAESFYISNLMSFFSNISVSSLNIASNPGVGLRFEDCSTTAPNAPYWSNDWNPSYYTNGFLASLTVGNFAAYTQRPVTFINCSAMKGFIAAPNFYDTIGGTAAVYAKDCIAYLFSFGKNIYELKGQFINCDGGWGSFGDAFDYGSGLTANYSQCIFTTCSGDAPGGLPKALPIYAPISNGGRIYHFTTMGSLTTSPVASGLITWLHQQYNV